MFESMSTASEPTTSKGRATRQRLLEAARELAITTGGHLEISLVGRAAGVVPSLVHRYFGSKAGLVCALVDDFYDRFHSAVFALDFSEHGDWAHRERLRLEAGVRFHYGEPFAPVVFGPLAREPEVAQREAQHIEAIVARAARSIRKGQRAGELPLGLDAGLAGAAMFGALRQTMVEALTRTRRPSPERVIEFLWIQVAAAVGIDPEASLATKPYT